MSCHLSLRQGRIALKTVAEHHDLALALVEHAQDQLAKPLGVRVALDVLGHRILDAQNIKIGQGVAVAVGVDGFVDGNLHTELFPRAKKHQDLVRYPHLTARR